MASIMFFPFPAFGHLNPTLKLARMLKQAGHQVCHLGFAEVEEYICFQGLDFVPILDSRYSEISPDRPHPRMKGSDVSQALASFEAGDRTGSKPFRRVEREFERIIREANPDLLIVDFLIGCFAYKAAREFGVNSALLSVTYTETPMLGAPADGPGRLQLPALVLCPEEFGFRNAEKITNRYYIEASVDLQRKELSEFPWQDIDASKPLIYCSLGSHPHMYEKNSALFRAIIEAMRERPEWQLALSVGPYLNISDFHPIPENALVVNWAPQLEMLKRASVMITHGGLGTVKECILLGVPMIVFPCKWDQPFNAARVVAHGLGVRGNINNVNAWRINSLIDTVVGNPSFKRKVDAMSEVFNEIENSGIGVRVIHNILARPCPSMKPVTVASEKLQHLS